MLLLRALLALHQNLTANPQLLCLLVPVGFVFFLGALVYSILMSVRLSLAFPACVHESLTARQSMARSSRLTRGAKGRILFVVLLSYALLMIADVLVGILVFAVSAVRPGRDFRHSSPLASSTTALACLLVLARFFLWIPLLHPA